VRIREWSPEDFPHFQRIMWDTWVATYGSFIPESDLREYFRKQYSLEALEELYHRPAVEGFIADIDGEPAGCARTQYNESERRAYVSSLYVLPRFQGQGVGTRLLRRCEEFALQYGVHEVWLGVMEQNLDAVGWYKRVGFKFVEEAPFTIGLTTVNHCIGYRSVLQGTSAP
jgi:ribosomal protein S18 acetylase RimI-like enzyme